MSTIPPVTPEPNSTNAAPSTPIASAPTDPLTPAAPAGTPAGQMPISPEPSAAGVEPAPADPASGPAAEPSAAAEPVAKAPAKPERESAAKRPKVQTVVEEKRRTPEQRASRGARIAGSISMPLMAIGTTLIGIPLAIWYVGTVFRALIVAITNMINGPRSAETINGSLNRIDPAAMGTFTVASLIVGVVLVIAAFVVSYFVLRRHGANKPWRATVFAIPCATTAWAAVMAVLLALGGLMFNDPRASVADVLGTVALSLALFAILSLLAAVAVGWVVWWFVERMNRDVPKQ